MHQPVSGRHFLLSLRVLIIAKAVSEHVLGRLLGVTAVAQLRQLHRAAKLPGKLRSHRGSKHTRMPERELHKLRELGSVGLQVLLGEAVHGRRSQVSCTCGQLHCAGELIVGCQHSRLAEDFDALVVAVGSIRTGVDHGHHAAGVLEHDRTCVDVLHLFNLGVVAMPDGPDRFWLLSIAQNVKHVEAVDQRVLEDAAAGSEIFQWGEWVVTAARLDQLQFAHCACIQLLL